MTIANFNGNLVISCFSPINLSEENDVLDVYKELSAFVAAFPKHNMLIIGGGLNVHNGNIYTNKRTTCHKITNRNENCFYENAIKMNYVFSAPNSKNVWVNYGFSRTLMVLKSNKTTCS